jgi:membrane protein YqaA with SNARE-associated domain
MAFLLAFLGALLVDTIPVFAPPAWMLLVLVMLKFKTNPWALAAVGAAGSTIGRFVLSWYMPRVAHKLLDDAENDNIKFLGRKLGGRVVPAFVFVLLYSLTPLSTTALFTAAGAAKVNPLPILPAFFIGKLISDAVMLITSKSAIRGVEDLWRGQGSPKSVIITALGVLLIGAMLFIDWKQLLVHKRLRLRFSILRK